MEEILDQYPPERQLLIQLEPEKNQKSDNGYNLKISGIIIIF